ncbi:MAG: DinB family protein [Terriglobales bacterium]
MEQRLPHTVSLLARTPATLTALLSDLPEAWTHSNEGGATWSVCDVIGHLVHTERTDWMPRARMVLRSGEAETFEPLDRLAFAPESQGKPLTQSLVDFARLRSDNLDELRAMNLQDSDLALRGRHPALGSVALSQLVAAWAVHDLTHLHQISRIMAHQYRDATGPWVRYLGVLQCNGHSSP